MKTTTMLLSSAALALSGAAQADLLEGFEDITNLEPNGWFMQNNSVPIGVTGWFQGNDTVFPAQSGPTDSYLGANYNNCADPNGVISNWCLTPVFTLENGHTLTFYTRCPDGSTWPDRLQVRMSTNGASTDVGTGAEGVGDFTELLLDINPNEQQFIYPEVWTLYTATVAGLSGPTDGRLALRYYIHNAGPSGASSNYIGIDTLVYTETSGTARMFIDGQDYSPHDPITDPTINPWNELWPNFGDPWACTAWTDNGSGVLDECDFMQFSNGTTWHVDTVTASVIVEETPGGPPQDQIYLIWANPPFTNPVGQWTEMVPAYGVSWNVEDWVDDGDGILGPGDWLVMDNGTGSLFMSVISGGTNVEVFEEVGPDPCPADVNGDNTVNVLDLLDVLAVWGATSGPADINGDGIVNVLDLLEVLGAWGPCP